MVLSDGFGTDGSVTQLEFAFVYTLLFLITEISRIVFMSAAVLFIWQRSKWTKTKKSSAILENG